MNLVGTYGAISSNTLTLRTVKWLGKDTLTPLAIDGKGGKGELLEKVGRWVAARGRNVIQPGNPLFRVVCPLCQPCPDDSDDSVL